MIEGNVKPIIMNSGSSEATARIARKHFPIVLRPTAAHAERRLNRVSSGQQDPLVHVVNVRVTAKGHGQI